VDVIVLATHSAGKKAEFSRLLLGVPIEIRLISDYGLPVPMEDGTSFAENACIKALAAARATGETALAEDSGLVIEALDGRPGIHTADWFTNDQGQRDQNLGNQRILDALTHHHHRRAHFISVIVMANADGSTRMFEAETSGMIAVQTRGSYGFGFDPIFIPDGADQTFGEMDDQTRLLWSARRKVCDEWRNAMFVV